MFSFNHNHGEGVIIVYRMDRKKIGQKGINRICRKLYGYTDYSNKKQYTYRREGLLDTLPHIHLNPIRSALILRKEDAGKALEILQEEGAEASAWVVRLGPEDVERMEESLQAREQPDPKSATENRAGGTDRGTDRETDRERD